MEILASQPNGYIARCLECDKFHVVIGTVISQMSATGFKNLCRSFNQRSEDGNYPFGQFPVGERLVLGTGNEHINLFLKLQEFKEINTMLQEALIEISLEQELNEILA